jgi:hypothetical protein
VKVLTLLLKLLEGVNDVSNEAEDRYIQELREMREKKIKKKRFLMRLESRYEDNEINITVHQIKKIIS